MAVSTVSMLLQILIKNSLLTPGTAVNNGFGFGYLCLVCLNFSHNLLLGFLLWHSNALPPEYRFLCGEGIRLRCSSPSCRMFRFQTLPMTLCQSFPKQSPSHGQKCRPYSARTQAARCLQPTGTHELGRAFHEKRLNGIVLGYIDVVVKECEFFTVTFTKRFKKSCHGIRRIGYKHVVTVWLQGCVRL